MPILDPNERTPNPVQGFAPAAVSPQIFSPIVDSRFQPLASLMIHAEGAKAVQTYYRAVVDIDSELSSQQVGKEAIYQSYWRYEALPVRVTSDLSASNSQDSSNQQRNITGAATYPPYFVPNKGDMFLMDVGDGTTGVFTVTLSEKRTMFKETLYQVEYLMVNLVTPEILRDLERKVVKRFQYSLDFLAHGQNPVVVDEDFQAYLGLRKAQTQLLTHYMADAYSLEVKSLILPDQPEITYDAWLVRAVLAILDTTAHPTVQRIKAFNVDGDQSMEAPNLWNCLLTLSSDLLPMAIQRAGIVSSAHFSQYARFEGVFFAGVDQVVYPIDRRTDVDSTQYLSRPEWELSPIGALQPGKPRVKDLKRLFSRSQASGFTTGPVDETRMGIWKLPDIHLVNKDDYYVLSEAFYTDDATGRSKLEAITHQLLNREPVDLRVLNHLVTGAKHWGNLERFYYIPLLLIHIKTALRGF